ncbi:MAG: hypothetical protein WDZ26_02310 [Nitriliruptoraceae bacterium]
MSTRPRVRTVVVLTIGALAMMAPAASAITPACDDPSEVRVTLAGDGEVTAMQTFDRANRACEAPDVSALVDVSIVHRADDGRVVEHGRLPGAGERLHTEVLIRDRTAADHDIATEGPRGPLTFTERVGVPMLTSITVSYPSGWSVEGPTGPGTAIETSDARVQVHHAGLLFPPITERERRFEVSAMSGRGIPTITVRAVPVTSADELGIPDGLLDRSDLAVIAAFTDLVTEGAEELVDGTRELADGTRELADGTRELSEGARELSDGTDELADGMREYADGVGELADAMPDLTDGSRELADAVVTIADAMAEVADGADQLADGAEKAESGADDLATGIAGFSATFLQQYDNAAGTPALVDPVRTAVENVLKALTDPAQSQAAPNQNFGAGSRSLTNGLDDLADGARELADGTEELADGTDELADGTNEYADGIDELADGILELADAAEEISDGTRELADGTAELADGTDELADGTDELADGTDELAEGAEEFPAALREIAAMADRAGEELARTAALTVKGAELARDHGPLTFVLTSTGAVPLGVGDVAPLAFAGLVGAGSAAAARPGTRRLLDRWRASRTGDR